MMFAFSFVLPVPGVELEAFVDRTTSQNTGTSSAAIPRRLIPTRVRQPPNWAGVMTIRAVLGVAATRATAADALTL
jgi:hypothetical protein